MSRETLTVLATANVAYLVKDFADGWILHHTYAAAKDEADGADNLIVPISVSLTNKRGAMREYRVDSPRGYCRFSLDGDHRRLGSFGGETWPFAYPEAFEPRNIFGEPIKGDTRRLNLMDGSWGYYVRDDIELPRAPQAQPDYESMIMVGG